MIWVAEFGQKRSDPDDRAMNDFTAKAVISSIGGRKQIVSNIRGSCSLTPFFHFWTPFLQSHPFYILCRSGKTNIYRRDIIRNE